MKKQTYIVCPICGKHKFPTWEDNGTCICPHCGWGHDTQSETNPFEACGPNDLSLTDYQIRYDYYVRKNPKYHWTFNGFPEIPQVEKSKCPVCDKFEFEPLSWADIACDITPSDSYCLNCGWHYSTRQIENPNLKNDANEMSLYEYRMWYKKRLEENPEYNYFNESVENYIPTPHKCPVCGKYEFKDKSCFDICPYCGWEDDGLFEDNPNIPGGANETSLNKYRKAYNEKIKLDPNYHWDKDNNKH